MPTGSPGRKNLIGLLGMWQTEGLSNHHIFDSASSLRTLFVISTQSPFSITDAFPHICIKSSANTLYCEYIMAERVIVKCKYNIIAFYLLIKGLKIPLGLVQFILCCCLKEKKSRNICTDDCRIRQTLFHRLVSSNGSSISCSKQRNTIGLIPPSDIVFTAVCSPPCVSVFPSSCSHVFRPDGR